MRLTPRKTEIASVVTVLEDSSYENAEALAKDVIEIVADLFEEREWYAYAWRSGPGTDVLAWGPLSSEKETIKFAEKVGLDGQHIGVKLFSTASMRDRVEKGAKGLSRHCTTCDHPLGAHQHPMNSNRCAVGGCDCDTPTS